MKTQMLVINKFKGILIPCKVYSYNNYNKYSNNYNNYNNNYNNYNNIYNNYNNNINHQGS